MDLLYIVLMAQPKEGESMLTTFLPLILIFVVFYFFMIRPQTKKAKETKNFRDAIKKGDKVVTIGGIHGKVTDTKEKTITIETEGGNKLKIERTAISKEFSDGSGGESELAQQK